MINHLLLLFFMFNLFAFLLAADEVNTFPLETSPSLGSQFQPTLPQWNINYEALAPDTNRTKYLRSQLNFEKDDLTYCPHVEFLTIILNELRNLLPQSSEKVKHVLSHYYTILKNSLNSKHSAEYLNKLSSENRLHYMEFLADKLIKMDDKNAKVKISFEYELPTIHKTICEKVCNDLINFANAENSPKDSNLNYANYHDKINNNIMTILQNYRPDNINSNSPSYILKLKKYLPTMNKPDSFYPQYSDTLSSNQLSPNIPISDSLQSQSQLLSNHTETAISDSLHNFEHLLQSPTETDFYSKENLSLPPSSPTGKTKLFFLPNFAFLPLSPTETANTAKHSKQQLSLQLSNSKAQNSIPTVQTYTGSLNYYPLQSLPQLVGINHLQMLPHSHIPSEAVNPYKLLDYPNPLPYLQGNIKPLQNAEDFSQNAEVLDDSYPIQNLVPQQQELIENTNEFEKFEIKNNIHHNSNKNSLYHYETQELVQNTKGENADQYISKNNLTAVTPKTSENIWSQPLYISANNMYSNNEKLLQKRPNQFYSQHEPLAPNFVSESIKHYPANLYQNLNANALSSIKQYESEQLQMDSLLAKASSLDYNPYLQPVKKKSYPQTNPTTGYLLNQQIPYSYQKIYPFSYEKNDAIYNSFEKKNNQLDTHSNIPSKVALHPNSYYYYPNLGITNSAKDTPESYGVQFQDLNRLLGVSNLDKLNSASNKNEIVELTFKLNNSKHSVEPFFYVKFRLPYVVFLFNLNKLLSEKPNLRKDLPLLLKHLIIDSNITSSNAIKKLNKDELLRLLSYTNDVPVTARVLDANDTSASEQIKIIQNLNANMSLKDIIKTDANITQVSELTTKDPSIKYLRNRDNYLNDFQRTISGKKYFLNPYKTQGNQHYNEYVQRLTNLNNKPTLEYNYLQKKPNNPYSSDELNSFSRYNRHRG